MRISNCCFLTLLFCFSLVSCGSVNMLRSGKTADFVLITEGELGGAYALVTGTGNTCKITEFGEVEQWQVTYDGKRCTAQLNGGARDRESSNDQAEETSGDLDEGD